MRCGEPHVKIAIDLTSLQRTEFGRIQREAEDIIRRKFPVPADKSDVITWLCGYAGSRDYIQRYGDTLIR